MEPNNEDKGWIEKGVLLYPKMGYITTKLKGKFIITDTSMWADDFEVSIDGSEYSPVDFSKYVILCYPILSKCNAQFIREVSINSLNKNVLYKIEVTQCNRCEEDRITENYVLVPKFPSDYTVSYDVSFKNLE